MSQKPGQAPHIFTPNTDPTAAENNPVGGGQKQFPPLAKLP